MLNSKFTIKIIPLYLIAMMLSCISNVSATTVDSDSEKSVSFLVMPKAQGQFQQRKYFKILKQPIRSSGELFLEQGLGFLWQTNKPVFDQLLLKKDGFYHFDGLNPIVKMKGADVLAQVIMKAMLGDINALSDEFLIDNESSQTCLKLTPKEQGLSSIINVIELCHQLTKKITATNNQEKLKLEQIILHELSGNRTEIDVQLMPVEQLSEAIRAQLQ